MDTSKLNERQMQPAAKQEESAAPGAKRRYERPELKKLGLLRQLTWFSF